MRVNDFIEKNEIAIIAKADLNNKMLRYTLMLCRHSERRHFVLSLDFFIKTIN